MRFIFTILIFLSVFSLSAGNIGTYYPFPNKELPVGLFHSEKEIWAVTNASVYKVEKGFFVQKYRSSDSIICAVDFGASILIGSVNGLIKYDKLKNSVTEISLSGIESLAVMNIIKNQNGEYWICTQNSGVFVMGSNEKMNLILNKPDIIACGFLSTGTMGVIAKNAFYYMARNTWQRLNDSLFVESIGNDSLRSVIIDNDGFLWIIRDSKTNVYQIQTSVGKNDTLVKINNFDTKSILIKDFEKVPDLGVVYNTSRGFFIRYGILNVNPLFENTQNESYTLENFMQQDITKDFSMYPF